MEKTKLTIRIPRDVLEGAKRYASDNRTSLTRLVSEYLRRLTIENDPIPNAPTVQRLTGILSTDSSIEDYHRYLEEKYGDEAKGSD